jgi:cellulose synthase/poly-beta-1,6-N-acetylglucosamine synthase-like glycosyltransferase
MAGLFVWAVTLAGTFLAGGLSIECLAGLLPPRRRQKGAKAPRFVVLMPAHDEARGITPAISAILAQVRLQDELIVVADNCTDATARIARDLGATVIERADPTRRGKGHALDFARGFLISHRSAHPADVVIVVDADCIVQPGALPALAAISAARDAVVQGAYLMVPPNGAETLVHVSCFAFLVKNFVRQTALDRLAGAALLQGSGMAFPRETFTEMHWRVGSLVEDLDMGLELLLSGRRVIFGPEAMFLSPASSRDGTAGQRRRWEHGILQTAMRFVPRLLRAALRQKRPGLAVIACDLLLPPTVLLGLVVAGALVLVAMLDGFGPPLLVLAGATASLVAALLMAWWRHGRATLPLSALLRIPGYVLWKLPLLAQFVTRRERNWLRTEREL